MSKIQVATLNGDKRTFEAAQVAELKNSLRGHLLQAEDAGYEEARQVWNGMIDKRPALIARCTGAADIIRTVKFARQHNLLVSVRGGGHNAAGYAVCDEGLMIDLSPMKGIHVDPHCRTARVAAGATLGDLDHETQMYGLAAPDEISSNANLWSILPSPDFPEALHWQPTAAVVAVYSGPVEEGERAIQPLRELATPIDDHSSALPFTVLHSMFDPLFPTGQLQYYWRSLNLSQLSDEAIDTLIAHAETRP